ncbi:MAG: glycosyltransferase [Ignavibacteriales bacterium]
MQNKYMFLYLNTGGGHLAPAKAIANQITKVLGDKVEVLLIDGLANANKNFRDLIEKGYKFLQNKAPWFYEFLYAVNKFPLFSKSTVKNISKMISKDLENLILTEKPHKIVIFHSFLIEPTLKIIEKLKQKIPVLILVTDPITPPPIWFFKNDLDYIVFSDEAKKIAKRNKVPEKNLTIFPFALNDKFEKEMTKNEIDNFKKNNDIKTNTPMILIIGGADGIPKGKKILKQLVKQDVDAEIAIVCGRNKKLFKKISEFKNKNKLGNVKVFGFVEFVYELMNSADIVISKSGASTFMEILLTKKIPIISSYLWEQEKGNVDFIIENNLGIYETSPRKVAKFCAEIISDKEKYYQFRKNIISKKIMNGTEKIAEFIVNYKGENESFNNI